MATEPSEENISDIDAMEDALNAICDISLADINNTNINSSDQPHCITYPMLVNECLSDEQYQLLATTVKTGFPSTKHQTPPSIWGYWEVRERFTVNNHIALLDKRIVIPKKFRKQILNNLHTAHQGPSTMQARANKSMYWPGINNHIKTFCDNCKSCSYNAPSQSKEPLIWSPQPEWPFQQICGDYFDYQEYSYLAIADRFSGWLCLYCIWTWQPFGSHIEILNIKLFFCYLRNLRKIFFLFYYFLLTCLQFLS